MPTFAEKLAARAAGTVEVTVHKLSPTGGAALTGVAAKLARHAQEAKPQSTGKAKSAPAETVEPGKGHDAHSKRGDSKK